MDGIIQLLGNLLNKMDDPAWDKSIIKIEIELLLKYAKYKRKESNQVEAQVILPKRNSFGQWIKATPDNLPDKLPQWVSDEAQNAKVALWDGKQPILVSNNFKASEDGKNGYTHYLNLPPLPKL